MASDARAPRRTPPARARTARAGRAIPFADPVSTLPATARKILAAAQRLLAERGYEAVTLENVAAEAGVNKASIRYNFGNKAGLVIAVVDAMIHDECLRIAEEAQAASCTDRTHAAIQGMEQLITGSDGLRGYFDLLPQAFRDDELRERLFALYRWWYVQNLAWFGLADGILERPEVTGDAYYLLMGLAELIAAIPDGLSIQKALAPESFDVARPLAALELLMRSALPTLQALAASSRATAGEPIADGTASGESPLTQDPDGGQIS